MNVLWVMNKQLDVASDKAYISIISRYLKKKAMNVTIVARYFKHKDPYDGNVIYLTTSSMKFIKSISYFLILSFKIFRLIKQTKPDVIVVDRPILVFSFLPLLIARSINSRYKNLKLVLDVRSLPNSANGIFWDRFTDIIFNLGLKFAGCYFDGCMAITQPMAKYIAEHSNFTEHAMGFWSSAFDAKIFDPETTTPNSNAPTSSSTTIIYHGSITNNRMLLESVSALSIASSDVNMQFLGDGPLLPSLKKLTEDLGLNKRVTFLEPVEYEDVPAFLKAADIGIVPIPDTLWFNVSMPIKLLEYMSMGLPIIAPLTTPVLQVIADKKCDIQPYKISTNQIEELAFAIDKAVENWNKGYFSELNRKHVLNRFSWQVQTDNIYEYLNQICAT